MEYAKKIEARSCLFCGGSPLSKEHVWANWLREFIPRDAGQYRTLKATLYPDRSEFKASIRPEDIHLWKVRYVCAPCNNGWMSRLQKEAKCIVTKLLRGEKFILDRDAQGRVAAWVAMAVIAGDAADRNGRAISQEDLRFFKTTKGPPLNWRIAVGDLDRGSWPAHWIRHPFQIVDELPKDGKHAVTEHNAQFTSFVTGRLFAHVCIAPTGTKLIHVAAPPHVERKMRQIWPPVRDRIEWPVATLTGQDADLVARAGMRRLQASWEQR